MAARPSAVVGMPSTPIVRAITRAPYLAASPMTLSRRAGSAEAELSKAGRAHFCSPASIAARFVVSSESGTSVTCCTASTSHGMISAPSFFWGPMLRSTTPAPASTWRRARSCRNFASRASIAAFTGGAMIWMFSPMMSTGGLLPSGVRQKRGDKRLERAAERAVGGELHQWPTDGIELRDQGVVGQHGQQLEAVLLDGPLQLRRQSVAGPIDDQVVPADLRVQLVEQGGDAPGRGHAAHARVADDEQHVDVAGRAP